MTRSIRSFRCPDTGLCLYLIDKLLFQSGKRLSDWESMPQSVENWGRVFGIYLIVEQTAYDREEQGVHAAERIANLTQDQKSAFEQITSAITIGNGQYIFLQWPGVLGRHTFTTPCAITCTLKGRLCSVLPPLGLQHFFSKVAGLLTPGSRSPTLAMSLQCAVFPRTHHWQS
jgi:hypothetical protein